MGASAAKWFEDGCCECVGYNCVNYGINESRCSSCSRDDNEEDEGVELEDLSDEELAMLEKDLEDELYSDDDNDEWRIYLMLTDSILSETIEHFQKKKVY